MSGVCSRLLFAYDGNYVKMKIHLIVAAIANFMKIAPFYHELNKREEFEPIIIHTGQHYDLNMSDVFFKNL